MDQYDASDLYFLADELSDYLNNALTAARAYRDRCLTIGHQDNPQSDDETYLAAQRKIIAENMLNADNALYQLN
jgi:hypothetical protein